MSSNVFRNTPLLRYEEIEAIFDYVLYDLSEIATELFSIDRVTEILGREMNENMKKSVSMAIYEGSK